MAALASDDGREVVLALEALREGRRARALGTGRYRLIGKKS